MYYKSLLPGNIGLVHTSAEVHECKHGQSSLIAEEIEQRSSLSSFFFLLPESFFRLPLPRLVIGLFLNFLADDNED